MFAAHLDVRPTNLVDTQLAHAFLDPDFSASYAKLVQHYLGLVLGKHETLVRLVAAARCRQTRSATRVKTWRTSGPFGSGSGGP